MTGMRNPVNKVVRIQQLGSPAAISDQQLAIHEVVPGGFSSHQQAVQFGGVGHAVCEEADPDGGVYQNHQAAALFLRLSGRRLGTSFASASEPLSFRNL